MSRVGRLNVGLGCGIIRATKRGSLFPSNFSLEKLSFGNCIPSTLAVPIASYHFFCSLKDSSIERTDVKTLLSKASSRLTRPVEYTDGTEHRTGKVTWPDGKSFYEGELLNDLPHGSGTWINTAAGGGVSRSFTGEWEHGVKSGRGTSKTREGTWSGVWKGGKLLPHSCTIALANGCKYQGDFRSVYVADSMHFIRHPSGQGTITYPDGSVYTGPFVLGVRHGQGKTVDAAGQLLYEGMYDCDQPTTAATVADHLDEIYTGDLVEGVRHGYGILISSNGDRYEGQWMDGQRCGFGEATRVLRIAREYFRYEGQWKADRREGLGKCWFSGAGGIYEGQWINDLPHGLGRWDYNGDCGEHFYGEWVNGKRKGGGTFTDRDGNACSGLWLGKFLKPISQLYQVTLVATGATYTGRFGPVKMGTNGRILPPTGLGTITYPDGTSYKGKIVDGQHAREGVIKR